MPTIAALDVFSLKSTHYRLLLPYMAPWIHQKDHEFIASLHESAWKNAHRVDIVTMTMYTQQLVGDG